MAKTASELAAVTDSDERRSARLAMREAALRQRLSMRRAQSNGKLADALAKFGGGSLLTATLLLVIGGRADLAAVLTAALTLFFFLAGTIFWLYYDRRAAHFEFHADRLDAVLKETERMS